MQPDNPFFSKQVITRLAAVSFGIVVSLQTSAVSAAEHTRTEEGFEQRGPAHSGADGFRLG